MYRMKKIFKAVENNVFSARGDLRNDLVQSFAEGETEDQQGSVIPKATGWSVVKLGPNPSGLTFRSRSVPCDHRNFI